MPWKTMNLREQRVQFVVVASRREKPFGSLCEEFGITRPTGYLWLERYRQDGVSGIAEGKNILNGLNLLYFWV